MVALRAECVWCVVTWLYDETTSTVAVTAVKRAATVVRCVFSRAGSSRARCWRRRRRTWRITCLFVIMILFQTFSCCSPRGRRARRRWTYRVRGVRRVRKTIRPNGTRGKSKRTEKSEKKKIKHEMGQISSGAHTSCGYGGGGGAGREVVSAVDGASWAGRARRAVRGRLAHTRSRTRSRRTRGALAVRAPSASWDGGGWRGASDFRGELSRAAPPGVVRAAQKPVRPAVPRTRNATAVTGLPRPRRRRFAWRMEKTSATLRKLPETTLLGWWVLAGRGGERPEDAGRRR